MEEKMGEGRKVLEMMVGLKLRLGLRLKLKIKNERVSSILRSIWFFENFWFFWSFWWEDFASKLAGSYFGIFLFRFVELFFSSPWWSFFFVMLFFIPSPSPLPVGYSSISSPPPPPGILPSFNSFSNREISCRLFALRIKASTRFLSFSVSLIR